jgi:hypothetical protein
LLAEWQAAEERLYPIVMFRPDHYQAAVHLVGRVATELERTCPDLATLSTAALITPELVKQLALQDSLSLAELDVNLIAGAACLMRYRQLAAAAVRQRRIDRIAAAALANEMWVVVEEGPPPTTFPPLPAPTVEMHVPSGRALQQIVEVDIETGHPRFALGELTLDPATGDPDPEETASPLEYFGNVNDWREAIARWREGFL